MKLRGVHDFAHDGCSPAILQRRYHRAAYELLTTTILILREDSFPRRAMSQFGSSAGTRKNCAASHLRASRVHNHQMMFRSSVSSSIDISVSSSCVLRKCGASSCVLYRRVPKRERAKPSERLIGTTNRCSVLSSRRSQGLSGPQRRPPTSLRRPDAPREPSNSTSLVTAIGPATPCQQSSPKFSGAMPFAT